MSNGEPTPPDVPRDWRAVIVATLGLITIFGVVVVAFIYLPGAVKAGETDNASGAIGGIAGAAVAAIGTLVSAYFGIRAANVAREETQKSQERVSVKLEEVLGATDSGTARGAIDRADDRLRKTPG